MSPKPYHNPENVDESRVPDGWRFLYADEAGGTQKEPCRAWVEMQYAEARFAGWALRLAPNDPDTDSVLHKTGEAIRKLQPFLKTKGILP